MPRVGQPSSLGRISMVETYPSLCSLFLAIFILFISILAVLTVLLARPPFLVAAVGQTAQELPRLGGHAIHTTRVYLDTPIQRATRLLEIHTVSLFQQGHVVKVVDQREVPRIGRIDFLDQAVSTGIEEKDPSRPG